MIPVLDGAWIEGVADEPAGCCWLIQSFGVSGPFVTWTDYLGGIHVDEASLDHE